MVTPEETARRFWREGMIYPSGSLIKPRRLHELNYLVPRMGGVHSLTDVGCGDGALSACLWWLCDLSRVNGIDSRPPTWEPISDLSTFQVRDVTTLDPYPAADLTIMAGVINYAFDDATAIRMLGNVRSDKLYVRSPCSMLGDDQLVHGKSEALGTDYAAIYRTLPNMLRLMRSTGFLVMDYSRVYPDELESPHGTKQYAFWCKRLER